MNQLVKAALAVRTAVQNEEVEPRFHRRVMERHRREWPTLWKAIDAILVARRRMTPFSRNDWSTWGGAEADEARGLQPRIGYLKVADWPEEYEGKPMDEVTIIVDKHGIVIFGVPDGIPLQMDLPSIPVGTALAESLPEPCDWRLLVDAYGFRPAYPPTSG